MKATQEFVIEMSKSELRELDSRLGAEAYADRTI
jgi:hypothetical protein